MYVHMYGMYVYVYMYVRAFSTNLNARYGLEGPGIEYQ